MKRVATSFFILALICVLGFGAYLYVLNRLAADPLPKEVVQAQNALAIPGLAALARLDVRFARQIEEVLVGLGDENALPDPVRADRSFLGQLRAAGVDFKNNIDHALAATVLTDQGPEHVVIFFGRFPQKEILSTIKTGYQIAETKSEVLILNKTDPDTCKAEDGFAALIQEDHIVFGSTTLINTVLKRIKDKETAIISTEKWDQFSNGKVFAAALFMPQRAEQLTTHPLASGILQTMKEQAAPVESIYAGGWPELYPPGLNFETHIIAAPDWTRQAAKAVKNWRKATKAQLGKKLPQLSRLQSNLEISASGKDLALYTRFDETVFKDITELPAEIVSFLFDADLTPDTAAQNIAEQTVGKDTLPVFQEATSHEKLLPFAKEQFTADAIVGPFGLRVKSLRLDVQPEGDTPEITLEIRSGDIPNTPADTSHIGNTGNSIATVHVTNATGPEDTNVLLDENCGKTRNSKPAVLNSTTAARFVGDAFENYTELQGEKTIRLVPGTQAEDVQQIEGFIRLRLPVKTKTLQIQAPFADKLITNNAARLKFDTASTHKIKYHLSGKTDMVLDVRALNDKEQYLASSGAMAMDRFFGSGRTVTREYQGKIATVEIVLADEVVQQDYPFTLKKSKPAFKQWDWPQGHTVKTLTKDAFLTAKLPAPDENSPLQNCRHPDTKPVVFTPLLLCPAQILWAFGDTIQAQLQLALPTFAAVLKNPAALEISIDKIHVGDKVLEVAAKGFGTLSNQSANDINIEEAIDLEIKTPEKLVAENITKLSGQITLRLPTELATFTLDVTKLGNTALNLDLLAESAEEAATTEAPAVASAQLVGFSEGRIEIEIQGDRRKILQIIPYDGKDRALKTMPPRITSTSAGNLLYSLRVSGIPARIDIVYADAQDRLFFDFELPTIQK